MTRNAIRSSSVALAILVDCLAGCQHLDQSRPHPASFLSSEDSTAKYGAREAADMQVAVGRWQEKQGNFAQAAEAFREALKHDTRRADAYLRLAILYDSQGKFQQSTGLYRKALQANPGNPDIFCDMGYSLYLQRRWDEAEMNLRQAIALRPDLLRAHNNLGLLLAHTSRDEEALAEFRKGGSRPGDEHLNLAFALTLDGRWSEVRRQYELALLADPSSNAARKGVQALDSLIAQAGPAQPEEMPGDDPVQLTAMEDTSPIAVPSQSRMNPSTESVPSTKGAWTAARDPADHPSSVPDEPEEIELTLPRRGTP